MLSLILLAFIGIVLVGEAVDYSRHPFAGI